MTRWNDGIGLYVNATPNDGIDRYDIWHSGGPGGPMLTAHSRDAANAICAAINELLELRAEVEQLRAQRVLSNEAFVQAISTVPKEAERQERATAVAWLRREMQPCSGPVRATLAYAANGIERGDHRREEEP